MPDVISSNVEQNLPAAIRGGDDADGAVFIFGPLRSVPMGVRVVTGISSVLSSTYWTRSSVR